MYNRQLDELTEKGRRAENPEALMKVYIEIANVVSEQLASVIMPVSEISAAPTVMILERYADALRRAINSTELDEQIAVLREATGTTEYSVPLE